MIWAILALLGVPLWLCAIALLILVLRNRGLRKRALDIPMRLRVDAMGPLASRAWAVDTRCARLPR